MDKFLDNKAGLAAWLLRLGLAFAFLYASIASFVNPREWIGYLPSLLTDRVSAEVLLKIFSMFELALAAWLVSGVYLRYAALVAAAAMAGVVVANPSLFVVTFRDVSLMIAALALAALETKPGKP
jgi:hypothetical protein